MLRKDILFCYLLCYLIAIVTMDLVFDTSGSIQTTLTYYKTTHANAVLGKIIIPFAMLSLTVLLLLKLYQKPSCWKNWVTFVFLMATALYFELVLVPQQKFLITVDMNDKQAYEASEVGEALKATYMGHLGLLTTMLLAFLLQQPNEEPFAPTSRRLKAD